MNVWGAGHLKNNTTLFMNAEIPASSPVILCFRWAKILQNLSHESEAMLCCKHDSKNHHKWIQLVNTILGIVNKKAKARCEFNISCQLWMPLSGFVRKIESANKEKKYGCVVKLKASSAVSDSISCSSSYGVLQVNSYLKCRNITTIAANLKHLSKTHKYGCSYRTQTNMYNNSGKNDMDQKQKGFPLFSPNFGLNISPVPWHFDLVSDWREGTIRNYQVNH